MEHSNWHQKHKIITNINLLNFNATNKIQKWKRISL